MDQATPPWRAFTSDSPAATTQPTPPHARDIPRWVAPVLAGLGGLLAGATVIGLAVIGIGAVPDHEPALPFPDPIVGPSTLGAALAEPGPSELVVHVAGAVVRPGLHRLRTGDRVGDAIQAAGGFAPRADLTTSSQTLNLAQPLEDGAKVLVPELGIGRSVTDAASDDDGRIDINRAGSSELESLPGVGPVTAGKIIEARESERFEAIRDLRSRGLVGEKVYEDIKRLVRVN